MIKKYFLPNGDAQRVIWLNNFDIKLLAYAAKLGLLKPDTDSVHNDNLAYAYMVTLAAASKTFEHNCSTSKSTIRNSKKTTIIMPFPVLTIALDVPTPVGEGIFTRISLLVKKIKSSIGYSEAIGKDLGIIGAAPDAKIGLDTTQVLFTAKNSGGYVQIKYTKGDLDGIKLESKRGNETEYELVDKINIVTYTDKRPNLIPAIPEVRQYRAWGFVKNEIVGVVSDVVSITVTSA